MIYAVEFRGMYKGRVVIVKAKDKTEAVNLASNINPDHDEDIEKIVQLNTRKKLVYQYSWRE